jgi:hypothetical protein
MIARLKGCFVAMVTVAITLICWDRFIGPAIEGNRFYPLAERSTKEMSTIVKCVSLYYDANGAYPTNLQQLRRASGLGKCGRLQSYKRRTFILRRQRQRIWTPSRLSNDLVATQVGLVLTL